MKNKTILNFQYGLVFICSILSCKQHSQHNGLEFESDTLNIGVVKRGKTKTILVKYNNNTSEPIKIIEIAESCNCIETTFSDKPLKPTKNGAFELTYNNGLAPNDSGRIVKSILVYCDTKPLLKTIYLKAIVL